jgi:hypothetical protein
VVAAVTSSPQAPLAVLAAVLVTALPAAAAGMAALGVQRFFDEMARSGSHGGIAKTAVALATANRLLIVAALAGAIVAAALGIISWRRPAPGPAAPAALGILANPLLACGPALGLWSAEAFVLDVLGQRVSGGIFEASLHLQRLLVGTVAGAGLAVVLALALGLWSLRRRPPLGDEPASRSALPWLATAACLLALGAGFLARASYLHDVALSGRL